MGRARVAGGTVRFGIGDGVDGGRGEAVGDLRPRGRRWQRSREGGGCGGRRDREGAVLVQAVEEEEEEEREEEQEGQVEEE